MAQKVVLYGHRFCPQVKSVKSALERSAIPYDYVDIHQNEAGRLRVVEINDGNESVPTLEFEGGSTLTEPSSKALLRHMQALGYGLQYPSPADRILLFFRGPNLRLLGAILVLLGLVFDVLLLTVTGFLLLFLSFVLSFNKSR